VIPIRQQNPPGPLKLLGLREKTGKNTNFLILLKTPVFLVYATAPAQCVRAVSCYGKSRAPSSRGAMRMASWPI
jgi:hypothetical protein